MADLIPNLLNGLKYTGPAAKYKPHAGTNQDQPPTGAGAIPFTTYANVDYLTNKLDTLITKTNQLVGNLESDLVQYALPVTDDSADEKLKNAHNTMWPDVLGVAKDFISYRYYRSLEDQDTSAATYIRDRWEQAARDVGGTTAIDIVPLVKIMRSEAFTVKDFVDKNISSALDDSSQRRTTELFQDWTEAALHHTNKLQVLFDTRSNDQALPDSDIDQISPEEARQSQAIFKVNLNKVNIDLTKNLAYLKKNFSDYGDLLYNNFLGPALSFRNGVTRKVVPILPGTLGREVNVAANSLNDHLSEILADQTRRNQIFHTKMEEVTQYITTRDRYRSYVNQLSTKGKSFAAGTVGNLMAATDAPSEVAHFESAYVDPATQNLAQLPIPTDTFTSSHQNLDGRLDDEAHPQYVLGAGDEFTGDMSMAPATLLDGMRPSTHEHDGHDGTVRIKGGNILKGSLGVGAFDPSDVPDVPQNIRLLAITQRVAPNGVVVFDVTIGWDGDPSTLYEVQLTTV